MAGLGNGAFPANDDEIGGSSGFDIPVTKMVQEEGDNEDNGGNGDNEEEEKESRCEGGGRRYSDTAGVRAERCRCSSRYSSKYCTTICREGSDLSREG